MIEELKKVADRLAWRVGVKHESPCMVDISQDDYDDAYVQGLKDASTIVRNASKHGVNSKHYQAIMNKITAWELKRGR